MNEIDNPLFKNTSTKSNSIVSSKSNNDQSNSSIDYRSTIGDVSFLLSLFI